MLPSAAAAALVVTATGAAVAESAPLASTLELTAAQAQTARDQAAVAVTDQADLSSRRQQVSLQNAAFQGRAEQTARVARNKARVAAAAKAKAAAAAAAAKAKADAAAAAKAKMEREGKQWVSPIEGAQFTSGYGMRWGRMHWGNDFGTAVGTPLRAMSRGTVVFAGWDGNKGKLLTIKYWDGTESQYAHMSSFSASVGSTVMPGDIVGRTGNTGRSTGPHLHLEIHPAGKGAVNPAPWLAAKGLQ
ncbi:peptidase [Knoellia sinensis KCTC 19936]|uniref:Peptidase n=1 Tax=Knoellia sinensis KCTC 19936 TaxID=1385520 RepID=A0A0A0JBA4_9MICO|nr:M23 family metallopeptidase [Knoellia sinensis]KGN32901.1 peptidase [Knoellia sinensis KCTC 19936]